MSNNEMILWVFGIGAATALTAYAIHAFSSGDEAPRAWVIDHEVLKGFSQADRQVILAAHMRSVLTPKERELYFKPQAS